MLRLTKISSGYRAGGYERGTVTKQIMNLGRVILEHAKSQCRGWRSLPPRSPLALRSRRSPWLLSPAMAPTRQPSLCLRRFRRRCLRPPSLPLVAPLFLLGMASSSPPACPPFRPYQAFCCFQARYSLPELRPLKLLHQSHFTSCAYRLCFGASLFLLDYGGSMSPLLFCCF